METEFYSWRLRAQWTLAILSTFALYSGCALLGSRSHWYEPGPYEPSISFSTTPHPRALAEAYYLAGRQAEEQCNPACIDQYFAAAVQAWPCHVAIAASAGDDQRESQLYRAAVRSFIDSAVRFGRFNRTHGVLLASGQTVPIGYASFVWQPDDFATFLPVGAYESPRLVNRYLTCGVGVPYVVLSTNPPRHPFTNSCQPFAATAVIAPSSAAGGQFALQFYDPLRTTAMEGDLPIARDLTAPIAYAASQETDLWFESFVRPGRDDTHAGLHMREPFQAGKIPIVFVHGLASDPLTWAQLDNDLRAQSAIFSRYQFWFFRYDTGDPFLGSAARLRLQLALIRQTCDPARCDPNLSRMVLIGHSMGGLVSKLQVTYSGDMLWQAAATQPFTTIVTDPETRNDLTRAFFFVPSPDVQRVIYIATPHRGSSDAARCVGRISSALVEERPMWVVRHEQLVRDNPGAFREELQRRVPTSVDLLEPNSLILQATDRLPYAGNVALHSIIGDDRWSLGQGRNDGVVAVSSARLGGGETELVVNAQHSHVQRNSDSVREVMCILMRHASGER